MADRGLIYGGVAGDSKYDGVLLQNQRLLSSSSSSFATKEALGSRFVNGCSPSFLASGSMVSFGDVNERNKRERSFLHSFDQEENEADDLDEYFHQPEKKRRLTVDQVQFLEKCYEVENKLEPEKKVQLAKDLGLQPRQIAIWFQNRRARCKTKHLEKDYDALRSRYDNLKEDYDNLFKEKENLRAEALHLTDKLLLKEKEKGELSSFDIEKLSHALPSETLADPVLQDEMSQVSATTLKQQEDSSSAKSDVFDSESPRYSDVVHSSFLDQCDSSYIFEPDQSDISQDEEENFSNNLLPSENLLAMAEDDHCYSMTSSNLSNFGFPVEDHGFGFWSLF